MRKLLVGHTLGRRAEEMPIEFQVVAAEPAGNGTARPGPLAHGPLVAGIELHRERVKPRGAPTPSR
jgi:hypothetical protein